MLPRPLISGLTILGVAAGLLTLGAVIAIVAVPALRAPAHDAKPAPAETAADPPAEANDAADSPAETLAQGNAAPPIDAALIHYQQTAQISTPLATVHALAVGPDELLYVGGDRKVIMMKPGGALQGEIALNDTPRCLAAADRLYVGLDDHVEVFDHAGRREAAWPKPAATAVFTSLAVAEEDLFVADARNRIVWHYNTAGKLLGRLGAADPKRKIPGLLVTSRYFDLAVGPDGLLYVVNPRGLRVEAYSFQGDLEFFWGTSSSAVDGFFGCCNPAHIAILSDGRFVTAEKGTPRIKIYSPQGKFQCVVAGPAEMNVTPAGLAVDHADRVLVLDPLSKSVRVFAAKGAAIPLSRRERAGVRVNGDGWSDRTIDGTEDGLPPFLAQQKRRSDV